MNAYAGKQLGAYRLLEQIGQGGMATIFKAYQPSMDRYVAVKILPSHFTEDKTFVARFTQEARTLAQLEHPHILPVHDYGEQEGITYLVMRYIDAGTLKDLITQRGPLELSEATRIMDQVGRALSYAHGQGVIHRDIKPTNVLIDEQGNAFLTDFGIAKLVAGTAQFTATGAIVGTPAYMSPEQGLADPVDHRSDIYSLGVVLYEMVTGRVPFEAETPLAVLLKHINAPLPPPRQVKPDLPEEVERVILKAMAKSPDDRFQRTEEMVEALQTGLAQMSTEFALPGPAVEGADVTDVHLVEAPTITDPPPEPDVTPAPRGPVPDRAVAAPSRKSLPWLPIAGGVAALAVLLIAALLILPNLGGGASEATPTAQSAAAAGPVPDLGQLTPGWTNYTNGNFVRVLARQDDYLWAGGSGGLVVWDLNDRSYAKYGVADGLASNEINDLLVDGNGVLWVATEAGLNSFDGDSWLTFDQADGLDSDEVEVLLLDNDGALWAGTDGGEHGLNYYDGAGWGLPPVPPLPVASPTVKHLSKERNYGLWASLGEEGLGYFDGVAWRLASEDGLPNDYVYALLLTENDKVWVSFYDVVLRRDAETGEWETIPQLADREVFAIHQANDGSFWFGMDEGVMRYDPQTGDWQTIEPRPGGIPDDWLSSIIEDASGLWLGTDGGGVAFFDGEDWQVLATDERLGGNNIFSIGQDGSGALWFTHPGDGLTRYDPATETWQVFGDDQGALDWAYHLGVDADGYVWIGGYEHLRWYDGSAWQSFAPDQLAGLGTIFEADFGVDGVQWFRTDTSLVRHDPTSDEWTVFTAKDHPVIENTHQLYVASDGTIWAGGDGGLTYYDAGERDAGSESVWREPTATGDAPEHYITAIAEGPDGSLWVAANGALYQLDEAGWRRFTRSDDGWIHTLAVGPDGSVWVGGYGLGRFDPLKGAWQTFTTEDGLVNNDVPAIYVTAEGVVWVGTEGGVSRYVPEE